MRLRWESAIPVRVATWLSDSLFLPIAAEQDHLEIAFANAVLEICGNQGAQGATRDDRLRLAEDSAAGDRPPTERVLTGSAAPLFAVVAVGIATVDMERFAADAGWVVQPLVRDRVLGASTARVVGHPFVLLEPDTEGRLAASLARLGEGPVGIFLTDRRSNDLAAIRAAVRTRRVNVTAIAAGPFGHEFAVAAGRAWGPHVVVCESAEPVAGTIAR